MNDIAHYPWLTFIFFFFALWMAALLGRFAFRGRHKPDKELMDDFSTILAATLTLLGLIIGFSFSMATNRYDQRKNLEEGEANAIGTEYVRADLLPVADADKVRSLLRSYLDARIAFYVTSDAEYEEVLTRATDLQGKLWSAILPVAAAKPTPITALAVSGMNDVLNAEGCSQAMFYNHIPVAAWDMIGAIAFVCNLLVGYGSRSLTKGFRLLPILPLLVAIALMFIADIEAPRHGIIRVKPQNLIDLAASMNPHSSADGAQTLPAK